MPDIQGPLHTPPPFNFALEFPMQHHAVRDPCDSYHYSSSRRRICRGPVKLRRRGRRLRGPRGLRLGLAHRQPHRELDAARLHLQEPLESQCEKRVACLPHLTGCFVTASELNDIRRSCQRNNVAEPERTQIQTCVMSEKAEKVGRGFLATVANCDLP